MFGWRRDQKDFEAELQAHIAEESARLQGEGMPAVEADAAARRVFGNLSAISEESYERGRWRWFDELSRDFRYSLRTFRQNPIFTAAAGLTLALGIGATTAIFSIVDAALLRPLAYPDANRIVSLHGVDVSGETVLAPASFLDFRRWRRHSAAWPRFAGRR